MMSLGLTLILISIGAAIVSVWIEITEKRKHEYSEPVKRLFGIFLLFGLALVILSFLVAIWKNMP